MRKSIFTFLILLILSIAIGADSVEAMWIQISTPENNSVISLTVSGQDIFAGTFDGGIWRSTNYGQNWVHASLNNNYIMTLAKRGDTLLAGTFNANNYCLYITTNNGEFWLPAGFYNIGIFALAISENYAYAGTDYGVYVTSNGLNWIPTSLSFWTSSITLSGNKLYAGTYGSIFLSTNNGNNWTAIYSLPGLAIWSIATSGNNVYAGTDSGIYLGNTLIGLHDRYISSLAISGNGIITGTDSGVYLSTNNGQTWMQKNEGFPFKPFISQLIIDNGYLYAGTVGQWIWKRPLSEVIGIENISTETPGGYKLRQNYPNPFNPVTTIKFDIQNSTPQTPLQRGTTFVKLNVFDVTGREVAVLVNQQLQPGTYEVSFDGSALNSGVYFYKIAANDFSETRKMILLK